MEMEKKTLKPTKESTKESTKDKPKGKSVHWESESKAGKEGLGKSPSSLAKVREQRRALRAGFVLGKMSWDSRVRRLSAMEVNAEVTRCTDLTIPWNL